MSLNNTIVATNCADYQLQTVNNAVDSIISGLGGLERFVQPGQVVAIKPNLIAKKKPEEAATTHPSLVEAVVRRVQQAGAKPFIVDSPGGPSSKGLLNGIYRATGMAGVAERTGCGLSLDTSEVVVPHPSGKVVKQLTLLKVLTEADVIIALPKLKTHCMTKYTGAVKLMYGAIPGLKKAEYHFNMQRVEEFSQLLIDINTLIPPAFNIMDAVIGMEGDGPTAGSPREVGLLLGSTNPYALDTVCSEMIGIEPTSLHFIRLALEQGLCPSREEITVSKGLQQLDRTFKLPSHKHVDFDLPGPFKKLIGTLQPKPVFSPELCLGCGECRRCCPADAITMVDGLPQLKADACIRCFCCQELCPHKAVKVHQNWLGRKLMR